MAALGVGDCWVRLGAGNVGGCTGLERGDDIIVSFMFTTSLASSAAAKGDRE
jgi:hypothetical protein